MINIFQKSGLAELKDLENKEYQKVYTFMDDYQTSFLSKKKEFRSKEYEKKWPDEALKNWSRIWEYPYVYNGIKESIKKIDSEEIKILDFGSGVSFFTFLISDLGYNTTALDIDPMVEADFKKAIQAFQKEKNINFILSNDNIIPVKDNHFDLIYSVSVIEHIPDPISALIEIQRVLKKGGFLVLTIDLCLNGKDAIQPSDFDKLIDMLESSFEFYFPYRISHPSSLLTSNNSPVSFVRNLTKFKRGYYKFKKFVKHHIYYPNLELACMGMVLRKK